MTDSTARPSRRAVLRAGGTLTVAGAAVTVLAGCGAGAGSASSSSASTGGGPVALSAAALQELSAAITANAVGVGKATILSDVGLILSQPKAGSYVAFSNTCTHNGGKISELTASGRLRCPLHGSEFDPGTGEPKVGPADKPLASVPLAVKDGKVSAV